MSPIKAVKFSGGGNTFLILEVTQSPLSMGSPWARRFCDPIQGVATDGILFLREDPSNQADYIWDFYNSDGSVAEMCGNAARCAGQFCMDELKFTKKIVRFQTLSGLVTCERKSSQQFMVGMPLVKIENEQITLKSGTEEKKFFWVQTGVPHIVLEKEKSFFEDIKTEKRRALKSWAQAYRKQPSLGSAGANVTLVCKNGNEKWAVTFERGVEDFTQACGTGAVAAAAYFEKIKSEKIHKIKMPGGELQVDLSSWENPKLTGPSQKIAEVYFEGDVQ